MTTLFSPNELVTRPRVLNHEDRGRRRIPTGSSRLTESSTERLAGARDAAWSALLDNVRKSATARLELLKNRDGADQVPCPWERLVGCDSSCRCRGSGIVRVEFLRGHYENLPTALEKLARAPSKGAPKKPARPRPSPRAPKKLEASPEVPPRRDRWTKKSRLQYAKARREGLITLLCERDYEARATERRDHGEEPDPRPGLGYGQCARCLRHLSIDLLEIDHVDGVTWNQRACNAWVRAARYWREFEKGVRLRALCRGCNGGHLNQGKAKQRKRPSRGA